MHISRDFGACAGHCNLRLAIAWWGNYGLKQIIYERCLDYHVSHVPFASLTVTLIGCEKEGGSEWRNLYCSREQATVGSKGDISDESCLVKLR